MTIRLAQEIGMGTVASYAERFGVYDDMPAHLSFSLGAGETTLYKMVAAYGMFANGKFPTMIVGIPITERTSKAIGCGNGKEDQRSVFGRPRRSCSCWLMSLLHWNGSV